jgi:CHASE2 domain-containing sensor protein
MNIVIAIAFVLILGALGIAGVSMLRGDRDGQSRPGTMMRALAWRVGLSVLLFVCVLVAYKLGWIHPTGVPLGS